MSDIIIPQRITHAAGGVFGHWLNSGYSDSPFLISPRPMSLSGVTAVAGYVKIWTTLKDNKEFLSLSMSQRGMYTQLLLDIKKGRDNGTVGYRNWVGLGSSMGCDGKTARKTLGILHEKSLCTYHKDDNGVILITIPNYKQWQDLTVKQVLEKTEKERKSHGKIPPLRPDQSKPEQSSIPPSATFSLKTKKDS